MMHFVFILHEHYTQQDDSEEVFFNIRRQFYEFAIVVRKINSHILGEPI